MADQQFAAKLSSLRAFSVKWAWGSTTESMLLKAGQRLVIPGVIKTALTEWGKQKWKFLGTETIATRQLLKIQAETADGNLLVQQWNGVQDVTELVASLPVVGKIYQGSNNTFLFTDETASDFAIYNAGALSAHLFVMAIYDAQLQATGDQGT